MELASVGGTGGQGPDGDDYTRDEWLNLVEAFSARQLTMAKDKLVAISGLARVIAGESKDEYLAGLWRSNILAGLCWKRKTFVPIHYCSNPEHDKAMPEPTSSELTRPRPYRAPSWSWASVEGEIAFETTWLEQQDDTLAKLLEASVSPLGLDPYGQVRGGYLRLKTS